MSTHNDEEMSPSRRRVLELTQEGKTPRQIARDLDLSVERVHQHLRRLRVLGRLPDDDKVARQHRQRRSDREIPKPEPEPEEQAS